MRSPAELHPDIARELRDAFEQCPVHPTPLSFDLFERAQANGFNMTGYVAMADGGVHGVAASDILRNMRC